MHVFAYAIRIQNAVTFLAFRSNKRYEICVAFGADRVISPGLEFPRGNFHVLF